MKLKETLNVLADLGDLNARLVVEVIERVNRAGVRYEVCSDHGRIMVLSRPPTESLKS